MMPVLLWNSLLYIFSFFVIWAGSGLIVSSVSKISQKLRVSSFLISFVILGVLTSTPEIAVGLTAVASNTPGIFVGNLLGGIPVIFLFIIPVLALFGRGISLGHQLNQRHIFYALFVSILPFFVVLDRKVSNPEGAFLIFSYVIAVYFLQKENKLISGKSAKLLMTKKYSFFDIAKVFMGTLLVLVSSNIIVSKTLYFSEYFNIAPFLISLLVLSLGTNLPELSIAVRAIFTGRKDIAFGDYLGSAAANTFLFGVFTLMTKDAVLSVENFLSMFLFVLVGLVVFFRFSATKKAISSKEGALLLLIYITFVFFELFLGR